MKKTRKWVLTLVLSIVSIFSLSAQEPDTGAGDPGAGGIVEHPANDVSLSSLLNGTGMDLLDEDIDNVILQTNEFVTNPTFTSHGGPFSFILMAAIELAIIFSLIMCASLAYKMMLKKEGLDVLKLFKPIAVAIVLSFWYAPDEDSFSILNALAYVPNKVGSYTHVLYSAEAAQIQEEFDQLSSTIQQRDSLMERVMAQASAAQEGISQNLEAGTNTGSVQQALETHQEANLGWIKSLLSGLSVFIDKIIFFIAMITFKIGWWATMYCQQIFLGLLTVFGPIQWAFSILPKYENSWSKWIAKYITVHFYGAMLYFVGFYVLLLFDIVLSIQLETMQQIVQDAETSLMPYVKQTFFTAGYMLVASAIAHKCLGLVPDLAAWVVPEGEASFAARSFGEGVSQNINNKLTGMGGTAGSLMRM